MRFVKKYLFIEDLRVHLYNNIIKIDIGNYFVTIFLSEKLAFLTIVTFRDISRRTFNFLFISMRFVNYYRIKSAE